MANRGYLIASASPSMTLSDLTNKGNYYCSRHTIPLAWLFFFQPSDVQFVFCDNWEFDIRLMANRQEACAYFALRRHFIEGIVDHPDAIPLLDELYNAVRSWDRGDLLLMLPCDIWQHLRYEDDVPTLHPLFEAIAHPDATIESIKNAIQSSVCTTFDTPEQLRDALIG
jgi:hypothetical protein